MPYHWTRYNRGNQRKQEKEDLKADNKQIEQFDDEPMNPPVNKDLPLSIKWEEYKCKSEEKTDDSIVLKTDYIIRAEMKKRSPFNTTGTQ